MGEAGMVHKHEQEHVDLAVCGIFDIKPTSPGQLSFHLSPLSRSNANVINPTHPTAHFPKPGLEITTSSGSVQSLPPSSHFSRSGTQSPAQSLPCSTETETKKPQKYKIKSSYKAFAAIPTNTLLLEQKAIDEAISDSEESPAASTFGKTHSQFLLESESLRQQSEELYATIEQLLKDPLPMRSSSSTPNSLQKLQYSEAHKAINPVQKSVGRETKYANLYLSASESTESTPTRPGVIRPITIVQKVPAVPKMKENNHNPFRKHPEEYGDTEPRHSITTIHENEALGINELTDATTELNRDQHQNHGSQRRLERSVPPNTDYNQEALVVLEEE
ncbi:muscular LMNA-interacting protein [Rhincodon typus]|uniref:muscular LMNA-interacting protein n=1 Tax=Rhincodon typus TaxID=259920 RepID=UPI0020308DA3|nr:muscular LMNA-interacting protein [Rhincodon typus]